MDFIKSLVDVAPEIGVIVGPIIGLLWGMFKRAYNQYVKDIKEVRDSLASENAARKKLEDDNAQLNTRIDGQDRTITNLNQLIADKDKQIIKLQQDYATLRIQFDTLTEEKEDLAREKQEAIAARETAERELEKLQERLAGFREAQSAIIAALNSPPPNAGAGESRHDEAAAQAQPEPMLEASVKPSVEAAPEAGEAVTAKETPAD